MIINTLLNKFPPGYSHNKHNCLLCLPPLLNVFTIGVFDLTNSGKELLSIWVITVEVYRPSVRLSFRPSISACIRPSIQSFDCEFEVREPLVDIHQSGYFMRSSKCTNVIVFINTLLKYYLDDNNLIDFWLHLQWGKCSQKWDIISEICD